MMDIDLAEYDQFDEIKFLTNKEQCEGDSPLLVTLSSGSYEPSNYDDANCENDFVFLPGPPTRPPAVSPEVTKSSPIMPANCNIENNNKQSTRSHQNVNHMQDTRQQQQQTSVKKFDNFKPTLDSASEAAVIFGASHPLMTINPNGNPFYSPQLRTLEATQQASQPSWLRPISDCPPSLVGDKPIGPVDLTANRINNPNQVADLMHQIVTRSDSIYIAIPCDYCIEPIACPPSDISAWLNHMSKYHNCKVCPICNKLIGLGPRRDIEIMRRHVLAHFDDDWLDKRPARTNFTFGLQQHWFSGGKCSVKDIRSINTYYRH